MPPIREKRVALGGVQLALGVEAAQAERLKRTAPFRYAVGPVLRWLRARTAGHNDHATSPAAAVATPPAPSQTSRPLTPQGLAIQERTAGIEWYHTLELPHGVVTPGFADHRAQVPLYGLPADMRGLRALDVATFDGFWAFEMERRGAQVVAVDLESWEQIDFPRRIRQRALREMADRRTGAGFALAKELLGSQVERRAISVYDLSPDKVGTFDLVFVSDLLLHLRDPARALESIFTVVRPHGHALIAEPYLPDLETSGEPVTRFNSFLGVTWWLPSTAALKAMMQVAGFGRIDEISRFVLNATRGDPVYKAVFKAFPAAPEAGPGPVRPGEDGGPA